MEYLDFCKLISERLTEIIDNTKIDDKKITVQKLSKISNVSQSQIYKILSSNCNTTIKTLHSILSSLGVSLENFFNFSLLDDALFNNYTARDSSEVLEIIAVNLKIHQNKLYRVNGLTQSKLADNLGQADYRYISYVLNGRHNSYINIKISTLYNISKELGLVNEIYILFKDKLRR